VNLIDNALGRLTNAENSVQQRDVYQARLQLQAAGFLLHEAWRLSIQRPGTTIVNQ